MLKVRGQMGRDILNLYTVLFICWQYLCDHFDDNNHASPRLTSKLCTCVCANPFLASLSRVMRMFLQVWVSQSNSESTLHY